MTGVTHPNQNSLTIRWVGDLYAHHSLATVSRELICALTSIDDLHFILAPTDTPPYPADSTTKLAEIPTGSGAYDIEVRHRWPPDFTLESTNIPLVMIQPWEQGGIPASWIDPILRHVAQAWVPTSWVRECYITSGIPGDLVAVVPNGVDTSTFSPDGDRYTLSTRKTTKLLFLGGTILRKGADILLDAYCRAFSPQDDVCLVVKVFGSDAVYKGGTLDDAFRRAAADPSLPDIEVIDADLTREEVASVYRACDALVYPYRGEGFGLPIAEAMACSLPVIVTGYGACLDFCDTYSAYLLPYSLRPISLEGFAPSPAGFWWAEPDKDALIETMRKVVSSLGDAREKGAAGRDRIVSGFTWEMAAEKAYVLLSNLAGGEKADHTAAPPSLSATVSTGGDDPDSISAASRISSLASITSKALSDLNSRVEQLDSHVTQLNDNVRRIREQQLLLLLASQGQPKDTSTGINTGDLATWRISYLEQHLSTAPEADHTAETAADTAKKAPDAQQDKAVSTSGVSGPVFVAGSGSQSLLDYLATKSIPATNIASSDSDSLSGVDVDELLNAYSTLQPSTWQVIAILEGIERFSVANIVDLVAGFKRALVPAGILILESTYPKHLAFTESTDMNHLWIPPTALVNLLLQAGFTDVRLDYSPSSSRYAVLAVL